MGALSGATSEAVIKDLSQYLYSETDPKNLNLDQKDTLSRIITLAATTTTLVATDGSVTEAVNAGEVGRVAVESNYFTPIRNEKSTDILNLNSMGDEHYVVYALAEYMVDQGMLALDDVPSSVYSDMVGGAIVDVDTGEIIEENPDYNYYKEEFIAGGVINEDQFKKLIIQHPHAYDSLIRRISTKRQLDDIKTLGLQIAGGAAGVTVSFGQMGEPIIHPVETISALYQFATTEDKLLAIQMAVAMDLQNRTELLELHSKNNDVFGKALETSKNTTDALLILTSIYKASKELVSLIPVLKQTGSVVFDGVRYTYQQGKIVAQKILVPTQMLILVYLPIKIYQMVIGICRMFMIGKSNR